MRLPLSTLHNSQTQGFTLVELILVIGLFAVVVGVGMNFFLGTLTGRAKAQAHIEAQEQARLASEWIAYEIRRARGIEATSDFGVNLATVSGATLDLDMSTAANDPTEFYVTSGILYLKQGTATAVALTSDDVSVTNLTFTDLSSTNGLSEQILMNFTVHKPDPTGTTAVDVNYAVESSAELRGK